MFERYAPRRLTPDWTDWHSEEPLPPRWGEWHARILANIKEHIDPPAALGSGHRGLGHKCSCVAYMWALQVHDPTCLRHIGDSFETHTPDLGVEAGVPRFWLNSKTAVDRGASELLPDKLLERFEKALDLDIEAEPPIEDDDAAENMEDPESVLHDLDIEENCIDGQCSSRSASSECLDGSKTGAPLVSDSEIEATECIGLDVGSPIAPLESGDRPADAEAAPATPQLDPFLGYDADWDIGSEPGSDEEKMMMPNCVTYPGMRHVVDNLLSSTHKSMEHWPVFFGQLKHFESLLRIPERRERFVWTCLDGTEHQRYMYLSESFSASLYESRWREVTRFLKALMPLLPAFNLAWDTRKYVLGVDNEGNVREVQQRVEDQRAVEQGIVKFDPAQIAIENRLVLQICPVRY